MGRIFTASCVGALVVFVWGFLAWGIFDIYSNAIKPMPHDQAIVSAIKSNITEPGAFYFPPMPANTKDKDAMAAYADKHRAGPMGMLLYRTQGSEPMGMLTFVRGYLIYFVACMLMSCIMVAARMRTFALRLGFAIIMAAFAAMTSHASNWIWFSFPDSYATAMSIDLIIGWTLAGFAVAAIIKPAPYVVV